MRGPLAFLLSVPIWIYRKVISPWKPATCRFRPTCSCYALEALRVHGALRGSWLTVRRLLRCQPFCEPGYDDVPPRKGTTPAKDGNRDDATRRRAEETDPARP